MEVLGFTEDDCEIINKMLDIYAESVLKNDVMELNLIMPNVIVHKLYELAERYNKSVSEYLIDIIEKEV